MPSVPDPVRQLVDGLVDAAVVLDGERRVLHYNQPYAALCKLADDELARRVAAGASSGELFTPPATQETYVMSAVPIDTADGRLVVESRPDLGSRCAAARPYRPRPPQDRHASTFCSTSIASPATTLPKR